MGEKRKNGVVKTSSRAPEVEEPASAPSQAESDASTRELVARSILQHGPSTAGMLAERLDLTPAAVRRHLSTLVAAGDLTSRQQRVYGPRGRGRPASVFVMTDQGRSNFYQAYDHLAIQAMEYIEMSLGEEAIHDFAAHLFAPIEDTCEQIHADHRDLSRIEILTSVLDDRGYAAVVEPVASGDQLCQYHCPVAHVAERYPQLCDAETRLFGRILNSHVQRLATIAGGDGICTTHVPTPIRHRSPRGNS